MKEASGELSMTAVAVLAITAVGVIFTTLIWPGIKKSLAHNTACTSAYACNCSAGNSCSCTVLKPDGGKCSDIGAGDGDGDTCTIVCSNNETKPATD